MRVRAAGLAFAGRALFDGLDLDLAAGRTTCLLGPSGVGKTSLLRLIAGLAHGAVGAVGDGEGRPVAGQVAYMAQQDLLLPWASVLANVTLSPACAARPATPR